MTEQQWLASPEPYTIILHERNRSRRKQRLYACAAARLALFRLDGAVFEPLIELAEGFADEDAIWAGILRARRPYRTPDGYFLFWNEGWSPCERSAANAVGRLLERKEVSSTRIISEVMLAFDSSVQLDQTNRRVLDLALDIFGNPFRPVAFDPSWRTSTVVALAEQMYGSRDFAPMPILADALQDAGCDNEAILAHCRGDGPHVRGCWVVDLVLGKN